MQDMESFSLVAIRHGRRTIRLNNAFVCRRVSPSLQTKEILLPSEAMGYVPKVSLTCSTRQGQQPSQIISYLGLPAASVAAHILIACILQCERALQWASRRAVVGKELQVGTHALHCSESSALDTTYGSTTTGLSRIGQSL